MNKGDYVLEKITKKIFKIRKEVTHIASGITFYVLIPAGNEPMDFRQEKTVSQRALKTNYEKVLTPLEGILQTDGAPNNHYDSLHQPLETMQANMTPEEFKGFLKGNAIKYLCRMGKKDGEGELKEAKKARNYAQWLVEALEGKIIDPRELVE